MLAFTGALRPATAVCALALAGLTAMPLAAAQEGARPAESVPTLKSAAIGETTVDSPVSPDAKPAEPETVLPPNTSGPPPESDFKDTPQKDEPAIAVPAAPQPPSDPLGAALFARLADGKPLLARLPAKQRDALQAYYALGAFKPVWIADHAFTPAAKAVIARLRAAGEDALDPAAYPIPDLGPKKDADEAAVAEADLALSAAALLYARDARGARVNLATISKLVTPALDLPSAETLLPLLVAEAEQAGAKLQSFNPRTQGYAALKARLADLRGPAPAASSPSLRLPTGPVLKIGMTDPRVPQLRTHFGLPDHAAGTLDEGPGDPETYDRDVADAVAAFQRVQGLPANGNLTRATIVALATGTKPPVRREDAEEADLVINMERWRWLPGELGSDYVLVNVPEFRLRVYRGGSLRDETRVITGKPESPTPLFSGMMEYAVVNPSWYVPPSILKTMLASGRTGGFEVVRRNGQISLRQPPGERNALGFIKFMFPNQHAVYLHDTPNRSLFSGSVRALSHGCVRVDDPFRFAGAVLPDWTPERLKKLIGKGERTIRLNEKLPVHLAYFTAYLDDDGVYRRLPDIYGYDPKMKAALGFSEASAAVAARPVEPKRRLAEVPRPDVDTAPPPLPQRAARHPKPRQTVQRYQYRRQAAEPGAYYGERGLWTPQLPQSQPRSWW